MKEISQLTLMTVTFHLMGFIAFSYKAYKAVDQVDVIGNIIAAAAYAGLIVAQLCLNIDKEQQDFKFDFENE